MKGRAYTTKLTRSPSHSSSLPRTESAGGTTLSEATPLLGEQILFDADARANETRSAADRDGGGDAAATPPRSGHSPRKKLHGHDSDPRIGISVSTTHEVDTLVYSHDVTHDEISLWTRSGPTRRRGLLRRIFAANAGGGGGDPPFLLLCLGLAVGVAISCAGALGYEWYHHRQYVHVPSPGGDAGSTASSSSAEGAWHGVPYAKIGRESFGDPVSSIFDEALFHPSLLFGGEAAPTRGSTDAGGGQAKEDAADTQTDDKQRRLAADGAAAKPFLRVPFPTAAFWTNLVLLPPHQKHSSDNQYSYPVVAYPFSFQWSALGKLQASYSAARRVVRPKSINDQFAPDITVGSVEQIRARHVVRFDSLSVTLRFYADAGAHAGGGGGSRSAGTWETYLVQGAPYVTAKYADLAPELTALSDFDDIACPPTFEGEDPAQFQQATQEDGLVENAGQTKEDAPKATIGKKVGVCATAPSASSRKKVVAGVQFVVTTKENLTWLLFASEPISFEFDQAARRTIRARETFTGVLRLALLPPLASTAATPTAPASSGGGSAASAPNVAHLASSPGVKRLIYHAGNYPTGGSVSWSFRSGAHAPRPSAPATRRNAAPSRATSSEHDNVRKLQNRRAAAEDPKEHNLGAVRFSYQSARMNPSTSDVPLLTLVLPHHARALTAAANTDARALGREDFDLAYRSIKGRMTPVVGTAWSYEEELSFVGFGDELLPAGTNLAQHSSAASSASARTRATSRRPVLHESTAVATLDQSIRDLLLKTVESDLTVTLPVLADGAYGFGKQVARMAQLAHVAQVVDAANARKMEASPDGDKHRRNDTDVQKGTPSPSSAPVPSDTSSGGDGSGTTRRAYALLEKYLTLWLMGYGDDKNLVYDAQLGGILSVVGTSDMNADFGNARYNDHHFHYGYVLYAAAVLGRDNPKFVSQFGPFVDALFYDVAYNGGAANANNDGGKEIFFPLARHKSWFDGHSFASGLFPSANGKSQESSSEAVNCYYGAYLWARVRWGGSGDKHQMVDFTRLLLATEMTGAKTYWHMAPPDRSVSGNSTTSLSARSGTSAIPMAYNSAFRENYMVGNLGMTDVTCTTWFGTESIYVHLINFLPVTAITAELFDKHYVQGEQSVLRNSNMPEKAWKGYLICNKAIIDPNSAWVEAQGLVSSQLDAGISKSQVLFWVSTRDGFSVGTTVDGPLDKNSSAVSHGPDSKANNCASHEKCVAAGLLGKCCPTNEGVFLGCCT